MTQPPPPKPHTLEDVVNKLTPVESEYFRDFKNAMYRGAFCGGMIGVIGTNVQSMVAFRRVHPLIRAPLSFTITCLFMIGGAMNVVPHMIRNGLFTLPDDSSIKMALLHIIQLNNPNLNPQQMWSLLKKQKTWWYTDNILSDKPFGLFELPPWIPSIYPTYRPKDFTTDQEFADAISEKHPYRAEILRSKYT